MDDKKKYMVEFEVPVPFTEELKELIPEQQSAVYSLFIDGKLLNYTLSMDRTKLWALFIADSESALLTYIDKLPLSQYMNFDYKEIMIHEAVQFIPAISLN